MLSSCHAHPAAPLLLLLLLIVVLMRCPQRHTELSAGLGSVSHTHNAALWAYTASGCRMAVRLSSVASSWFVSSTNY